MDFPFQNNKNDLIWTRRCGEAGWLKQKILNPTCQAITSPNMNLTQQTSVSNEKITGNKEYSILRIVSTHYMQNSAFKLMHEYVFQTADEYFFCNNNVCCCHGLLLVGMRRFIIIFRALSKSWNTYIYTIPILFYELNVPKV